MTAIDLPFDHPIRQTAYDHHGGAGSPLYRFASTGGRVHSHAHRADLLREIEHRRQDALARRELDEVTRLRKLRAFVAEAPITPTWTRDTNMIRNNHKATNAGYPRIEDIDRFFAREMSVPEMVAFIKPLLANGKLWRMPAEFMQFAVGMIAWGSLQCPDKRSAEVVADVLDRIYNELEY